MKTLVKGGHLVDPSQNLDGPWDLLLDKDKVVDVLKPGAYKGRAKIVEATGCLVTPGFVDLHTHLREPGFEGKETILSGSRAAVAGGFTTILCMANTEPVNDIGAVTGYIVAKAKEAACKVYPVGATTLGLKGEKIANLGELKAAGVAAYSDDGVPIRNSEIQRRIFELAQQFDMAVLVHAEDPDMAAEGQMHEGFVSTDLGLPGIPVAAEEIAVARDILLSQLTGCRLHICHVSSAGALDLIRWAKKRKVRVTCEATPHHFTLTDEDVGDYNTNCKVAPPLRSREDRAALIKGLADGSIDAIATDHAPHGVLLKETEFDRAACGMIGLETALGLTLRLVQQDKLTLRRAVELLTCAPARIVGLDAGSLAPGKAADLCIFDPDATFTYTLDRIRSKSRNSPFINQELPGVIRATMVDGRLVYPD